MCIFYWKFVWISLQFAYVSYVFVRAFVRCNRYSFVSWARSDKLMPAPEFESWYVTATHLSCFCLPNYGLLSHFKRWSMLTNEILVRWGAFQNYRPGVGIPFRNPPLLFWLRLYWKRIGTTWAIYFVRVSATALSSKLSPLCCWTRLEQLQLISSFIVTYLWKRKYPNQSQYLLWSLIRTST